MLDKKLPAETLEMNKELLIAHLPLLMVDLTWRSSIMCNLYSVTKGQQAIRKFTRAATDTTANLPSLPGIFPDMMAPVVRNSADDPSNRELTMMRWGMPGPPQFAGTPVTNIRNTSSPHWRAWLGPASRCLVPATSFCEWEDTKPRKTPVWFALDDSRPLFTFAGIWTTWHGLPRNQGRSCRWQAPAIWLSDD